MTTTNNTTMTMYKAMNKAMRYTRKARKHAIVAISGLLEDKMMCPNKEFNTRIEGYDLDCYENVVTKVYKRGKQVRVVTQPEFLCPEYNDGKQGEIDCPINDLSDSTIVLILESMIQ